MPDNDISVKFKKTEGIKLISGIAAYLQGLDDDKEYQLIIKEYKLKNKRSLNANSYAWTLIDKLAVKLHEKKTDIYRTYIKDVGGNNNLLCIQEKAVDEFERIWCSNGLGWFIEKEPSKLSGCVKVRAYYGSSQFDTVQMARLIDLIIKDCKENNIETLAPQELLTLCEEWNK